MTGGSHRTDILVAGLGGIGSAVLYHVARQGVTCVGLEQFRVGHDRGSSHGESRIFRLAYFEDPVYVPLARRAGEGWRRLESETGHRLLVPSGGLDIGPPAGRLVAGSLRSCSLHDLPHEHWTTAELRSRIPSLAVPEDVEAVFQPDAGILRPEKGVAAHLEAARAAGAEVREETRLVEWEEDAQGVRVRVEAGGGREEEILAGRLVLTTGPWVEAHLPPGTAATARPERQVVGWRPAPAGTTASGLFPGETFPVVNAEYEEGHVYLMPPFDGAGTKVGLYHHRREEVDDPDLPDPPPDATDRALLQGLADRYLTSAGPIERMRSCRFTLTPDQHFLIDRIGAGRVVVGGGFSGHGYKFAPALGECIAALALDVPPPIPLEPFRLDRFTAPTDAPRTLTD